MPQIYYLWDFEDGTTQGWEILDPNTSLDSSGKLQGTYSIRMTRTLGSNVYGSWNLMRIRNIDISNTSRPLLTFVVRIESGTAGCGVNPGDITVTLYDSSMNQIGSVTFRISNDRYITSVTKCVTLSLEPYKTSLNAIMLSIYIRSAPCGYSSTHNVYIDMITIMEVDVNYNTSIVIQNGETREVIRTLNVSFTNSQYVFIGLISPPWFIPEEDISNQIIIEPRFQRADGQLVTLAIDSVNTNYKHLNGADIPQTVNAINGIRLYLKVTTISTNYAKYSEHVAVILMSSNYTYNYVILFRIHYTINPHTPITQSSSAMIVPGQSITRSFEMVSELRFNSGGIRFRVVNVTGNYTSVLGGLINISVYNYYTNELVGSVSVDPKAGNDLISDLVLIDSDIRYRIVITFDSIRVTSNVSFRCYIIYEVS